MANLYRVANWDDEYENSRSRDVKDLTWVKIPNKHDSDGYTEIVMEHENGVAHYACWVAVVQVASKCRPRGTLLRRGGAPHDSASLSRQTRIPAELFGEALPRFVSVGWLLTEALDAPPEVPATAGDTSQRQQTAAVLPLSRHLSAPEEKRREEKRREGKGRDEAKRSDHLVSCSKSCATVNPSPGEARDFCNRKFRPSGKPEKYFPADLSDRDHGDLLKLGWLVLTKQLTEGLIDHGLQAIHLRTGKPLMKPVAYLQTVIGEKLGSDGPARLRKMLKTARLPSELARPPPRGRA